MNPTYSAQKFRRLLQLGYVPGLATATSVESTDPLSQAIGNIFEVNADLARAILLRAGLPCASCSRQTSETIYDALRVHKVSDSAAQRLSHELGAQLETAGKGI